MNVQLLREELMNKTTILMLVVVCILLSLGACQKKEEQPVPKTPIQSPLAQPSDLNQPMPPKGPMADPHGDMVKKEQKTVQVPEDIKKSWGKVKLVFTDKAAKKSKEYIVDLGSELVIPGTDLKVTVGEFLPDFKIMGSTITSGSNEPNNPGVRVEISEKGKSIFKGWLYSKFPDMHPFEHDKYGLNLKEGVRK